MSQQKANRTSKFASKIIKQKRFQLIGLGACSLIITLIIFLVVIALFPAITWLPDVEKTSYWNLLEGVSSLLSLSLLIGGLVFVAYEYLDKETQKELDIRGSRLTISMNELELFEKLNNRLMSQEDLIARRWILENVPEWPKEQRKDYDPENPEHQRLFEIFSDCIRQSLKEGTDATGQDYVKRVLNTIDYIGFVKQHYWNMEDNLKEWMSGPVAKVWDRLAPYIEYEALRRGEVDYYYTSARQFGRECLEWWSVKYDMVDSDEVKIAI